MAIDIKRVAIWSLLKIIAVENKKWWSLKRPHHLVNKQEESCLEGKLHAELGCSCATGAEHIVNTLRWLEGGNRAEAGVRSDIFCGRNSNIINPGQIRDVKEIEDFSN